MNLQNQSKNPHAFGEVSQNDRNMAMLIWILSLFTSFIGPLVIWLMKKEESEYINQQGKNYFNYAISYAIYGIASYILIIVLIGYLALFVVVIASLIYCILGIIAMNKGEDYVVPFSLQLIK
ncbi:DUF4870 domain-containing protein [Staphylococcus croceilyticus]|uniref:DUF4870 domain-containing protein n=1 Tax=Staphylococcus croceilyticus TaxID=319942 RepID=A0ABY2KJ93_9STAP|nr:DUF4870 domain-containing protein [Staphylococcus croceilyticus]PNZ69514.1 DUF4870 domain-containing protein [Staphylococcus croceilyticus]TGA80412.1 DUF4870 domain-containing protein [Staphylococcus croceilyticus]